MGIIRALMMWIPMLLTPFSIFAVKKVSNLSRRLCISGSIFTTITICICFTFVAPIDNPQSITPCKKETNPSRDIKLNTSLRNNHGLKSSTTNTIHTLDVQLKQNENTTIQEKDYSHNLAGLTEVPQTSRKKEFYEGVQPINENINKNSIFSPLQNFQQNHKYNQKQNNFHRSQGQKLVFKETKLKQNHKQHKERADQRNTPYFTNIENKLEQDSKEPVLSEQSPSHNLVENQRNYENMIVLANPQRDKLSQSFEDYYQNIQHDVMPSMTGVEPEVDINYHEENPYGRQIRGKHSNDALHKTSITMPKEIEQDHYKKLLKKRQLEKLEENKNEDSSIKEQASLSYIKTSQFKTDNVSLPKLYEFQVLRTKNQFGTETFFTVLLLAVIYEILFSFFTPWADILCYESIEKYSYEHLLITQIFMFKSPVLLVSYPMVSILVTLMPCPYQLAMHSFAGAIVLLIAFGSTLFFLCLQYPDITYFRSRKPSKPPMEEHLEQNSILKFFKMVTSVLLGFSVASQAEYILWKADTLMGFPFNYEYLYCGYFTLNIFTYILVDKYLQYRREKENAGIEEEDSDEEESVVHFSYEWFMNTKEIMYTERQRSNLLIIMGTFFLSLTLFITSLIKEPWFSFVVALLKGVSDAFIESAVPQGSWMLVIFGYGVGCLIGSLISISLGINFIFYISCGMMLICFLGWLIHSLLYWANFGPVNNDNSRNKIHYRYFSI